MDAVDAEVALVALEALARRAGDAAGDVRVQAGVLRAAGAVPWRGAAADAFVARLEESCEHVLRLAGTLDDAEAAVRRHATRAAAQAEVLVRQAALAGQVLGAVGAGVVGSGAAGAGAVAPWR